jgi:uncharacterized protein (UPF0548 family)
VDLLLFGAADRLDEWRRRPFSPGVERGPGPRERRDSYELEVARERPGDALEAGPFRRAAAAIARYEIFPPTLLTPVVARTPVQVGDTLGARFHLAPGVALFFASRVIATFDELDPAGAQRRAGFTYRTLEGHPEFGEETFSVEKDLLSGAVVVALRAWSRPGNWLARSGSPVVRALQVSASRRALLRLHAAANGTSAS